MVIKLGVFLDFQIEPKTKDRRELSVGIIDDTRL